MSKLVWKFQNLSWHVLYWMLIAPSTGSILQKLYFFWMCVFSCLYLSHTWRLSFKTRFFQMHTKFFWLCRGWLQQLVGVRRNWKICWNSETGGRDFTLHRVWNTIGIKIREQFQMLIHKWSFTLYYSCF